MSEERAIQSNGPLVPAQWVDDDSVLKKIRETRLAIMEEQLAGGVPVDKDSFELMHKNLQELDKAALKGKQLKQEEKSSEAMAKLAMEISNNLARQMGNKIFQQKDPVAIEEAEIPNPTHLLGTATPAPGELIVGDDTTSYEQFNETVGKALDAARRASDD